jgi:nondiscriminating aspartyl-tRNA synthetase
VFAGDLPKYAGSRVRIAGWLHRQRQLSHITFLVVRDATGLAQVVVTDTEQVQAVAGLSPETVVAVDGEAVASEQAPGGVGIHEPTIEVLAARRPRLRRSISTARG